MRCAHPSLRERLQRRPRRGGPPRDRLPDRSGGGGLIRLFERLDELYAIGGGPGANRVAGSPQEDEAHRLAAAWMREARLEVEVDAHGNLFGHVRVTGTGTRPVWTGSHLDSVPNGGKYDGALGVVAALEAVERTGRGSVVVFRGEEVGCLGSRARAAAGDLPAVYLELHVEQGPVLADAGAALGVVTGIIGYARGVIEIGGQAGHAGTTPMRGRDDALVKAAATVLRIRDAAAAIEDAVATVGRVEVEPGAVNVIPDRVLLSIDARAPDAGRLDRLVHAIGFEPGQITEPHAMSDHVRSVLRDELAARGLPVVELPSGAGHDAGPLAAAGVAAGLLFVRSQNGGISHSPDELSTDEDVLLGVEVLTAALLKL